MSSGTVPLARINDEKRGRSRPRLVLETPEMRGVSKRPRSSSTASMFSTGTWSRVYANDGRTGELIWQYDPEVPKEWGKYACCDVVNRGVAVWKGRVFVGTLDGRLVALDAGTGEVVWEVLTIDRERPYTITGRAEGSSRTSSSSAMAAANTACAATSPPMTGKTGDQRWRFWTVPGDPSKPFEDAAMELAASTWHGEVVGNRRRRHGLGLDGVRPRTRPALPGRRQRHALEPGYPQSRRRRQPVSLASIVAINPDDGSRAWHYQTTPGETWDYTAHAAHDPGRHRDRRRLAQGHHAGAEERLFLRARPHRRHVHIGRGLRAGELGEPR